MSATVVPLVKASQSVHCAFVTIEGMTPQEVLGVSGGYANVTFDGELSPMVQPSWWWWWWWWCVCMCEWGGRQCVCVCACVCMCVHVCACVYVRVRVSTATATTALIRLAPSTPFAVCGAVGGVPAGVDATVTLRVKGERQRATNAWQWSRMRTPPAPARVSVSVRGGNVRWSQRTCGERFSDSCSPKRQSASELVPTEGSKYSLILRVPDSTTHTVWSLATVLSKEAQERAPSVRSDLQTVVLDLNDDLGRCTIVVQGVACACGHLELKGAVVASVPGLADCIL
jgi:hypothetical protein